MSDRADQRTSSYSYSPGWRQFSRIIPRPGLRLRTFGEYLGRGMTVAQAAAAMNQTAEGVASCGPVLELARRQHVEMPITEVAEAVMRDGLPVETAASMLASRSAKPEWYGP